MNRPQPTQSIISLTEASLGFETFPTTRGGGQRGTVSEIRLKPERVSLAKLGMRSMSVPDATSTMAFLKMLQKTRGKLQQGGM